MSYSKLREEQEQEMMDLLAERFQEMEHFKKQEAASWGNPGQYTEDIERLEKHYSEKIKSTREKHEQAKKTFLGEPDDIPNVKQDNQNPLDQSKIHDLQEKRSQQKMSVSNVVEPPKKERKFKFRRKK